MIRPQLIQSIKNLTKKVNILFECIINVNHFFEQKNVGQPAKVAIRPYHIVRIENLVMVFDFLRVYAHYKI